MDGASVVGLIAATIELANFTKTVVQRIKSFADATEDVPQALQLLHRRLPLLSRTLQTIQEEAERDKLLSSEVAEFADVVKPCSEELATLKERLQDLLPDSSNSRSVRWKKAIKSLKADSKIRASVDLIGIYLSDLASYNNARAIFESNQKTDRILELSVQTVATTSQLQQAVVALASKPRFLRNQLDSRPNVQCESLVNQGNSSPLPPRRYAYSLQGSGDSLADRCSCRSVKPKILSRRDYYIQNAAISHEISNPHLPTCPLYFTFRDSKRTSIRLRFPEFLLQRAVDMIWTCKYGAGGFSVSSRFDLKGVVRTDSPVSGLILRASWTYDDQDRPKPDYDRFCNKLARLFQDGKASPTELNARGETIAIAFLRSTCIISRSVEDHVERGLVLKKLSVLGVPLDETSREFSYNNESLNSLEIFISQLSFSQGPLFVRKNVNVYEPIASVARLLAQLNCSPVLIPSNPIRVPLMAHIADLPESFNCSRLHMAVLARSQNDVNSIIKADVGSLHERTIGGLQALHLAVGWPEGTKLLLDLGADSSDVDDNSQPPLYYAIWLSCFKTVKLLLAARSPLGFENETMIRCAADAGDESIYAEFIRALAARRKELVSYAQKYLPEQELQELCVDQHTVPDLEAMEIYKCLESRGHQIDRPYFGLSKDSVYAYHPKGGQTMQMAFDAGFTNIDRPMVKGRTLLQILYGNNNVSMHSLSESGFLWWHLKGVNLTHPVVSSSLRDDQILIIHGISMNLGDEFQGGRHKDPNTWLQCLAVLLDPKYMSCKDSCRCLCAVDGCAPLTNFLKVVPRGGHESLFDLISDNNGDTSVLGNKGTATSAAIRVVLFNALGLRHRCCQYYWGIQPAMEKDEADEIREEDRHLAKAFHTLLPKAIEGWKQSMSSLRNFWEEFHEQNIGPRRENIDWEHVQAVEHLGVRIEEI